MKGGDTDEMNERDETYSSFFAEEEMVVTRKAFYTTRQGFPNRKAFEKFAKTTHNDCILVCMNVDLRKANKESYDYGSYVLRKFILSLIDAGYAVFHITGEKFNILVPFDSFLDLKNILDETHEAFDIYYGYIITEAFSPEKASKLIPECVEKMFQDKAVKKRELAKENLIVRNTPPELQETHRRKFRCTTWYAVIELTVTEPEFKTVMVYVFPTEYKRPLATVKTIAVVYDMGEYHVYYDTSIDFGVGGILFNLNCRFDREGILNVAFFRANDIGEYKHEMYVHKGECIPANFGKRAGEGREIFPIRKNINGFFDYVLLKNDTAELNRDGVIKMNGVNYGVYQDDDFIELIPQV